jgi:hypothetical protein
VDELYYRGRAHDVLRPRVVRPELSGEQGEQRPEPLATGVDQV